MDTFLRLILLEDFSPWFKWFLLGYIVSGLVLFSVLAPLAKNKKGLVQSSATHGNQQIVQGSPSAVVVQGNNNTVTLASSHEYKAPSQDLQAKLLDNLRSFKAGLGQTSFKVRVDVETGSSPRDKVATNLGGALSMIGLGSYPKDNTFSGVLPEHPVTIVFSPQDRDAALKFQQAISVFVQSGIHMEMSPGFPRQLVRIYLYGDPLFNNDGSVVFQ